MYLCVIVCVCACVCVCVYVCVCVCMCVYVFVLHLVAVRELVLKGTVSRHQSGRQEKGAEAQHLVNQKLIIKKNIDCFCLFIKLEAGDVPCDYAREPPPQESTG